jgi:membrane-associated phospholipid phosphatase
VTPGGQLGGHFTALDDAVDRAFDRLRGNPTADRVFYTASALGDFSVLWMLLGSVRGLRSERDADAAIRLLVCLGLESALVNGLVKSLLPRARPVHEGDHPHHLRTPKTASFPSGHASAGFTAATLLADGQKAPWRYGWYGLAAAVASSRIHTRSHHASDVLAGAALGLVLGRVARRAWPLPEQGDGPKG